ncbi:MAG: SCO family protein, partial [Limnobacter sp.]|nr:SCO family protein [Limnobacter sp.]
FTLQNLAGKTVTLHDYQGKVVALFFGYTHCPDVCPVTLQQWAAIKEQLGEQGKRLQVLFVSVDPQRDTPELLRAYVPQFDPDFDALTGSEQALQPLLKGLKVVSEKVEGSSPANYLMNHSSSVYVFDTHGRLRLLVRYNAELQPVVRDIQTLIDQA